MNMNKQEIKERNCLTRQEKDTLNILSKIRFENQRHLAELSGYSLGAVNKAVRKLIDNGFVDDNMQCTKKAENMLAITSPQRAIILAAGFGMRMVPINAETPKALLEVNGKPLIERQIRQLQETGISEIYVVVGFMKERFEYLIDSYNVELIVNSAYAHTNNLHSVKIAFDYLSSRNKLANVYIVPCDLWCDKNPFDQNELYSWYMVSDSPNEYSNVRMNRKRELVRVNDKNGNAMVGISYLVEHDVHNVYERIKKMAEISAYDNSFWEEALYQGEKMIVEAKLVSASDIVEINTYEQLRDLDHTSKQLESDAISIAARELCVSVNDIVDIRILKKGMTNRSFSFMCNGKKYIMRIPGEGTDQMINRRQEADVYKAIEGKGICDNPIYINPQNGYKIAAFLEGIRVCNPDDETDLRKCMEKLRQFHGMKLKVNHVFDIFGQLEFYEKLWNGKPSIYKDYKVTKANVLSLKPYIDSHAREKVLTHIDAVPDNFLFYRDETQEGLQLTDWEYAGMQDPDVDIAMFSIYSLYDKEKIDKLISIYYDNGYDEQTRIKIYCYIAVCGLLWSNWCEYKSQLGVEFGEYSLRQYRYAKDFYRLVQNEMNGGNENE